MIRNRAVLDAVRDAIFLADVETGMIVDANHAAETLTGRSIAELRTLHHTQLHPPEHLDAAASGFADHATVPGVVEALVLHKDGHRIPVEIANSIFTALDGRRIMVGVFRNATDRIAARDALRRSEERFRQVAESAGEFIWEVDANGLYLYASPVVEQVLGYTPEEIVGRMHFYDLLAPETREEMKKAAFEVFARQEPFRHLLNWNVRKDGRTVALETSGLPIRDADGRLLGYRGADTDVTERMRAEQTLRESEDRYRTLFDQSGDCVFLLHLGGGVPVIVDANQAALTSHGYSREEMIGQPISLIEPEISQESLDARMRLVAEGKPFYMVHRRKDGSTLEVEGMARLVRIGAQDLVLAVGRNITERRQAEEALRQSELKYRRLHESITDAVVTVDMAGHILEFNPAYEAMLGYTGEEFRNLRYQDLTPQRWHGFEGRIVAEQVLVNGYSEVYEKEYRRRDGTVLPVELRTYLLRNEVGQPIGMWAIVRDITERKTAERALRLSEEKFAAIFRCSPVSMTVSDLNDGDRFLEVNEAFEEFTGHRREEVIGRCYPPDWLWPDPEEYARAVAEFTRHGRVSGFEFRFRRTSGEVRTGVLSAEAIEVNDRPCVLATTVDITERKQVEEALHRSEERFRSMFENATVGMYRTTPTGRIEMANSTLVRMLGYESFAQLAERNFEERGFEPGYARSTARKALEETGELRGWEAAWTRQDGSVLLVRESARCVRDADGRLCYYEGTVEDITERKKVEDALRESEARFAAAFRLGPAAMSIIDLEDDHRIIDVNDHYEESIGYWRTELIGRSTAELGLWLDPKEHSKAHQRLRADHRLRNFEFSFRRKDGQIRTGLVSAEPMQINNRLCAITCTFDITDRKQAESALRESETRLREAQRLAKVGSWVAHPETGANDWSDEMFRIFGISEAPSSFPGLLQHIHAEDRHKLLDADRQIRSGTDPVELEHRIVRPNGEVRFVRTVVEGVRDERGALVRIVGAVQDVTEQVQAREILRQSEARLRIAERLARVGYWDWDLRSGRESWSEETCRILGRPFGFAPTHEQFLQMIVPAERERVEHWLRDCLSGNRDFCLEFQIMRPDGEVRTLTSRAEILYEDGVPVRVLGSVQDITDSKRAQEQAFARQKLESLGTLASGIAHDFNNLLGGVSAQAELALSEVAAGSNPEEELRRIQDVALHGAGIVRQLMVYAGKEGEVVEAVDFSRIVTEMVDLLRVSVPKHAVLETNLSDSLPAVRANPAQLRQIVMNLVTNASEAMGDKHGSIHVTTAPIHVGPLDAVVKGVAEGDYVEMQVSDTGRGMTPEVQAKVFDPFFTTKSSGRGLGLPVVYGIVRKLGGTIHLESEVGKGTTFRILLPCAEAPKTEKAQVPTEENTEPAEQQATILVVEDEEMLRQAVAAMLRRIGFEVLEAADGTAAIELLRGSSRNVNAILLDLTIPGAPSHEVLAEAARITPNVKVILNTAFTEETAMKLLHGPQVRGFVRKPFRFAEVVQTLRKVLAS